MKSTLLRRAAVAVAGLTLAGTMTATGSAVAAEGPGGGRSALAACVTEVGNWGGNIQSQYGRTLYYLPNGEAQVFGSASAWSWVRILAQVPSRCQRRNRS